jgi:hypothetical protein
MEGSGRGLFSVLSQHFPEGKQENYESLSQDVRHEHLIERECGALPLCQPAL